MSQRMQSSHAQTACVRCREHKIRCSRQLPQCARCAKLGATCAFPEPPNRHEIAVRREIRKRQAGRNQHIAEKDSSVGSASATEPTQVGGPDHGLDEVDARSVFLLDADTHRLLQDTYFSCMYNSSLTFHRPTFDREYSAGDVAEHVLQAMYAMAVRLLPVSSSSRGWISESQELEDLRALSMSWASQAGQAALQYIDQPTLPSIQTCLILALFWFSRGDSRRNAMFSGIAYRAAFCLFQDYGVDMTGDQAGGRAQPLESELLRRCFWASWSMHCINSDQYPVGNSTRPQIMELPLPVSEGTFMGGKLEDCGTLGGKTSPHICETNSIMANLMKLALLWARVRNHIDAMRSKLEPATWSDAFALYDEIKNWKSQLHSSLNYTKENMYQTVVLQQQPVYLLLYVLHSQSCLVLHASLLPSLGGSLSQDRIPPEVVRVSADIALNHARALSDFAADLLELDFEPNRIAPFVGYSMYVAATVHMTIMAQESVGAESARQHLVNCLRLLTSMKPHWAMLSQLWDRVARLYLLQTVNAGDTISPQNSEVTSASQSRDLQHSINGDADTRSISEVVNDSVLHFSLRRLQKTSPHTDVDSTTSGRSALDELLNQSSQENMQNLMEEHGSGDILPSSSLAGPLMQEQYTAPTTFAENDFAAPSVLSSQPPDIGNWWEWNLDIDLLPYDYFFGMDLPTIS